jgi:MscS family membrane protein
MGMATIRRGTIGKLLGGAGMALLALLLAAGPASAQKADTAAEIGSEVNGWVEEALPEYLVTTELWQISLWQWMALLMLVVVAYAVGYLLSRVIVRSAMSLANRSRTDWDDRLIERAGAPFRLGVSIAIFYFGSLTLGLTPAGLAAIVVVAKSVAVMSFAWLAMRLVDLFAAFVDQKLDLRGDASGKTLVPMGRRVAKVFVLAIAVLSLLQNLGFNITGLLAGLGIGGLAVALAAQKTLENVFGGFVVIADRPVKIGDFCQVGEHMGTVEDIGMRSSRIRTLDRTVVSIPNAEFSTVRIENYAVRDRMRLLTVLQVGYDTTPDQMCYLLVEIRRMLHAHPRLLPTPNRVRFVNFGAHSLDIEVFAYINTSDYNDFTAVREDVFLRIMDIVAASGAYFAYPSQTLYLARDAGRDLERSAQAEAAVMRLREAGKLPIPEFPPELIEEIDDTIAYPPPGSATAAAG